MVRLLDNTVEMEGKIKNEKEKVALEKTAAGRKNMVNYCFIVPILPRGIELMRIGIRKILLIIRNMMRSLKQEYLVSTYNFLRY